MHATFAAPSTARSRTRRTSIPLSSESPGCFDPGLTITSSIRVFCATSVFFDESSRSEFSPCAEKSFRSYRARPAWDTPLIGGLLNRRCETRDRSQFPAPLYGRDRRGRDPRFASRRTACSGNVRPASFDPALCVAVGTVRRNLSRAGSRRHGGSPIHLRHVPRYEDRSDGVSLAVGSRYVRNRSFQRHPLPLRSNVSLHARREWRSTIRGRRVCGRCPDPRHPRTVVSIAPARLHQRRGDAARHVFLARGQPAVSRP